MMKAQGEKIRSIYGIVFSVFSVLVGVLFIIQTWSIYNSAPQSPYTVENIAKHFQQIAIPVWLWVVGLLGNILLAILYPEQEGRPKAYIDTAIALAKTKKQMSNYPSLMEETSAVGKKEEKFRTIVCVVCLVFVLAMMTMGAFILFGVCYQALIKTEFFSSHDGVADKLVQIVLLSLVAMVLVCVGVSLNNASRGREREYYQQETKKALQAKKLSNTVEKTVCSKQEKTSKNNKTMGVWYVRGCVFAVALLLLIIGVANGGMHEVFLKAINICTQCIGLG